jgi:leucyl aminopeptidase
MNIQIQIQPLVEVEADALILFSFDPKASREPAFDALANGWAGEVYSTGEFSGKLMETVVLPRPAGLKAARLILAGCGDPAKFGPVEIRRVAAAVARSARKTSKNIALALLSQLSPELTAAAVEGLLTGDYEPDQYKTGERKESRRLASLTLVAATQEQADAVRVTTNRARIVAEAQNAARDLANEPPNVLNPAALADRAASLALQFGLEVEVLDESRMRDLGMGALLGVAAGSSSPPRLMVLRYNPPAGAPPDVHLALVGKGVTFDSGGISIKPSDNMDKMKYDMAGGAAVLGAMRAIAQLQPALRVTALVPAVENMPGGRAQRPGDIVTSMNGKTVEVLNTDAEGRLILIDAFAYARRLGCTHIIDIATLTGAIAVALGGVNTGVFTNNDEFQRRVLDAARVEGEKMWPMPLDDDYRDMLKSAFADIPNISGGRYGGASTAAAFLRDFVEDAPWVHLDVAGTAWLEDEKPYSAKGPTGVGVRTFVRLVTAWR